MLTTFQNMYMTSEERVAMQLGMIVYYTEPLLCLTWFIVVVEAELHF